MSNEEILLDEIRTRCAELQTLIYELKKEVQKQWMKSPSRI